MQLSISGYSTALFATWYFIEELGLLFDAGDGVSAALLQKSRKINHVFISHADRDHLTGLVQLNQLNAREGLPVIHYPGDSGSFPAMNAFTKQFDPHVTGTVWKPIIAEERCWIRDDVYVESIRNGHVSAPDHITKSLSYMVRQVRRKLKPELLQLDGAAIRQYKAEHGQDAATDEFTTNLLGYSGDTPVEDLERWNNSNILIHEATFLGGAADTGMKAHGNQHSTLEAVMEMVSGLTIGSLILGHFSSRYAAAQIDKAILDCCNRYGINFPVHRVLPGSTIFNIQQQPPINA